MKYRFVSGMTENVDVSNIQRSMGTVFLTTALKCFGLFALYRFR